ncbi:hypothetical protein HDA32_005169 [Spinactinospora alkalitolerans]|uniref:Uncharacterized protein n=1 Tax=Spinactinospora alkalitolerans TaxID=687207 RepID=A0A852U1G8_9ACTN|nr:hypothetical protein [Spinactinospora alkalitolerans]NYE50049.1 hypothetical protein [Spinactinospora alkalitolerans]
MAEFRLNTPVFVDRSRQDTGIGRPRRNDSSRNSSLGFRRTDSTAHSTFSVDLRNERVSMTAFPPPLGHRRVLLPCSGAFSVLRSSDAPRER